jgi:methylsterol monooxygenase/4-alpha-methyl-delta7-sterol-4alpha-methyl oxidase
MKTDNMVKDVITKNEKDNDRSKGYLEELLNYEKQRYQYKGYGLIFATLTTLIWFFVVPQTAKFWWPKKIENEGKVYAVLGYLNHEFWFILVNVIFYFIYKFELSFFERYKITTKAWPWNEDQEKWKQMLKDTFKLLLLNHLIFLPLLLLPDYISNEARVRMDYESLPSCSEVIIQTIFFMVMEDFTFYWSHRFLHMDFIYPYVHKIHHKYVNTVCIAAEYAHPFEFIFGNVLTTNSGVLLLGKRTHMVTYLMWSILRIAETTDGHCGYEFSWSPFRLLPMSAGSEFHHYHHLAFKGNYASFFTCWDRVFNTVHKKYLEFVEKKQKLTKTIQVEIEISKNK